MKLPFRAPRKKKLQAATARRPREADFTEEPNVKLSSAFIVVLVLHVVAVGGIYAFNAIKAHQPVPYEEPTAPQAAATPAPVLASTQVDTPATPAPPIYYKVKSGDTIAHIAFAYGVKSEDIIDLNDLRTIGGIHVGQSLKLPSGAEVPEPALSKPVAEIRDSGVSYTVVRGDTPVSIARKLHVVYDDLIRLNRIEDPRKLRIGLRLRVPAKRTAV